MPPLQKIPLFLLNTVLFPEQQLSLRVFEARYMDMISHCLKQESPFGVCLIRAGAEVGAAAEPYPVGTLARIEQWEMPEQGLLHIQVRGESRFEIQHTSLQDKLVIADVALWEQEACEPIPVDQTELAAFLQEVIIQFHSGVQKPHAFDNASWVGMRLGQILPVENSVKQAWLAERNPSARLRAIKKILAQIARHTENN